MYPAKASGCLVMNKIGSRTMMFKGVECFRAPWSGLCALVVYLGEGDFVGSLDDPQA